MISNSGNVPHGMGTASTVRVLAEQDYKAIGKKPDEVTIRNVPCGTCQSCCKKNSIFIYPESGDQLWLYETENHRGSGKKVLKHKPNGDCWYLGDKGEGCTIHSIAPVMCREFDCRVTMLNPPNVYKKLMSPATVRAAKKQLKTVVRQNANRKRLAKFNVRKNK